MHHGNDARDGRVSEAPCHTGRGSLRREATPAERRVDMICDFEFADALDCLPDQAAITHRLAFGKIKRNVTG